MRQVITTNPSTLTATSNSPVNFSVHYATAEPSDETLTGLGLRLHFNSEDLTFNNTSQVLQTGLFGQPQVQADTSDFDGDANTDRFLLVSWTDFTGNWPGEGNTPATLYNANFTTSASFTTTDLNFSASSTAAGFELDADSIAIEVEDSVPTVANPVADLTINEDSEAVTLDLSNVFNDANDDNTQITKVIQTNSNNNLVNAAIDGNNLTLSFQPNVSGIAEITVRATSNGQTVDDVFNITVNPVNDIPTIEDVTFSVPETAVNGASVGEITVNNPDGLEALAFTLAAADGSTLDPDGDGINAFAIAPSTSENTNLGRITVTDSNDLDFETTPNFNLIATVTDQGGLSDTAAVAINLQDLPLTRNGGIFSLEEIHNLDFNLSDANPSSVNEIGLFTVDDLNGTIDGFVPGDKNYLAAAFERAQSIFSVLANPPQGFNGDIQRVLGFDEQTNFGLYYIPNDTSDRVKAQLNTNGTTNVPIFLSTGENLRVSDREEGGFTVAWEESALNSTEDSSSNSDTLDYDDLLLTLETTDALPSFATNPNNPEILDLTGQDEAVDFTMTLTREGDFNNVFALYEINNLNGAIVDPLTGETINATAANHDAYLEAAIGNIVESTRFTVGDAETATSESRTLEAGKMYAPIIFVDALNSESSAEPIVYTPFIGVNDDLKDHVRNLGDNIVGFEDLPQGGDLDYNDLVVQFDFI